MFIILIGDMAIVTTTTITTTTITTANITIVTVGEGLNSMRKAS
jgi:hypothetical protein